MVVSRSESTPPNTLYGGEGTNPAWPMSVVQRRYLESVLKKLADETYHLEEVPECLCGSDASLSIANHDRFGLPIGVVVCRWCGLARTTPRLAARNLEAFYRDDYHGLHVGVADPDPSVALYRLGQGSQVYQYVRGVCPAGRLRVGEIGSGTGQVLREFAIAAAADGRQTSLVGCDLSPTYVAAGRLAGTSMELGSAGSLLAHGPFDLIVLSHVVEHFADPLAELEIIDKLLAPDGLLYVEVPGILAIHRKPEYAYDLHQYLTLAHLFHFSLDTLTDVLGLAGYERIDGDEHVHSIFRRSRSPYPPIPARGADQLLRYLSWLRTSRSLRIRRAAVRVRRAATHTLRVTLGPRGYRRLKAAVGKLSR
jgi:SAM-dependent methyltransferase